MNDLKIIQNENCYSANQYNILKLYNRFIKRLFDIVFSVIGLILTSWIIILAFIVMSIDTRRCGFFAQTRVGRNGICFTLYKIRTMKDFPFINTTVTTNLDPRITPIGHILRKTKIDELPQLVNIFLGQMSFVGPRPDVKGFADQLNSEDKIILLIRPGITGPATLKYRNEEEILSKQKNPEKYNIEVIYPDKIDENKQYLINYSFIKDIIYILETAFPFNIRTNKNI